MIHSIETSPTLTSATSYSPESPRTITIEHQVSNRGNAGRSFLLGMSKPIVAIVAAALLTTTGSTAWLFSEWLTIPGFIDQISALTTEVGRLEDLVLRLENQVDRLSTEVDELANENERYSLLNAQLNQTAEEYRLLNEQLNVSTVYLSHLNEELNHSNALYEELNAQLSNENGVYASLNSELNETQKELTALNQDLYTVVSFLNNTSASLQRNLSAIVDFLADEISVRRFLVLETVKNTYRQRIDSWDCGYRDYFLTEDFIQDVNAPMDPAEVVEVLAYVDLQILSSLCLDKDNLEDYLVTHVGETITSNEMVQWVSRYLTLAMQHYFSSNVEEGTGIRPEEWADASYACSNLQQPFRWAV